MNELYIIAWHRDRWRREYADVDRRYGRRPTRAQSADRRRRS